ncbi:hypothetical protein MXD62_19425 [Frankia sp. Mgl5]|uniref:hypothetical protein n=1 Tax=Frankia sp. Mgl5 TaxID=2933793 RepID=UPI00200D50D5|nr:hypothetical protein [Frankia sp. Mgl5]MCK9929323.1 hypothetical protein [Frankia sp. Mgl5]
MALVPTQQLTAAGLTPTYAAAANGDTLVPDDRTSLRLRNSTGSIITGSITGVAPCSQGGTHNRPFSVPANGDVEVPTGPATQFAGVNGQAAITYSTPTGLTRAVVRI